MILGVVEHLFGDLIHDGFAARPVGMVAAVSRLARRAGASGPVEVGGGRATGD